MRSILGRIERAFILFVAALHFASLGAYGDEVNADKQIRKQIRELKSQVFPGDEFHQQRWETKLESRALPPMGTVEDIRSLERDELDPLSWLDIKKWIRLQDFKDEVENWEFHLMENRSKEMLAKVLHCYGVCYKETHGQKIRAQFRTMIFEGDEITLEEKSGLWVMLIDGTIIRVSSQSSLSFLEGNATTEGIFFNLRLNYGHFYLEKRHQGKHKDLSLFETDQPLLPLPLAKANREFWMRFENREVSEQERFLSAFAKVPGVTSQLEELNKHLLRPMLLDSTFLVTTPNGLFEFKNAIFEMSYQTLQDVFIHLIATPPEVELESELSRSAVYLGKEVLNLELDQYYQLNPQHKISKTEEMFKLERFLVRRIPSIYLMREYLLERPLRLEAKLKENAFKEIARNWGLRVWNVFYGDDELQKRRAFLLEHLKRLEDINFRSLVGLDNRIDLKILRDAKSELWAVDHYLRASKLNLTQERELLKEMSYNEFDLWVLRNVKTHAR